MRKTLKLLIFSLFATLVLASAAFGQKGETRERQIKFARGKSSATVKSVITNRLETHLYKFRARAGQILTVVFTSRRKDIDVCVLLPGNRDECGKRTYSFTLEKDGEYEILVDGHRENIAYTLTVSVK
jgi:hypothetical protein